MRLVNVAFIVVLCVAPAACASPKSDRSASANKELVRKFTEEVYNQQKRERIDAYVHPDFVDHSPGVGPDAHGVEYVKQQWDRNYEAFPDLRFTIDDLLADGDRVVLRWSSTGTFKGKLGSVSGKGQKIQIQGGSIFRVQDGKFIESWDFVDRAGMLHQIGFTFTPLAANESGEPGAAADSTR